MVWKSVRGPMRLASERRGLPVAFRFQGMPFATTVLEQSSIPFSINEGRSHRE